MNRGTEDFLRILTIGTRDNPIQRNVREVPSPLLDGYKFAVDPSLTEPSYCNVYHRAGIYRYSNGLELPMYEYTGWHYL